MTSTTVHPSVGVGVEFVQNHVILVEDGSWWKVVGGFFDVFGGKGGAGFTFGEVDGHDILVLFGFGGLLEGSSREENKTSARLHNFLLCPFLKKLRIL